MHVLVYFEEKSLQEVFRRSGSLQECFGKCAVFTVELYDLQRRNKVGKAGQMTVVIPHIAPYAKCCVACHEL